MKKMKKVFAGLLAATMVMSMSMTAFAADDTAHNDAHNENIAADGTGTVTITKTYNSEGDSPKSPEETFLFDVTGVSVTEALEGVTVPEIQDIDVTYREGWAGDSANKEQNITIHLPRYESVGVYTYEITEKDNKGAGVTYFSDKLKLVVTVINELDAEGNPTKDAEGNPTKKLCVTNVYLLTEGKDAEGNATTNSTKTNDFANKYSAAGLTVTKYVTGQLGDTTETFPMTVMFTAPQGKTVHSTISYTLAGEAQSDIHFGQEFTKTVKFNLKHGESAVFTNIPYGVKYTVVEDTPSDYTATYKLDDSVVRFVDSSIGNSDDDTPSDTVVITNNKGATIETGISLDSAPYILLLAFAAMGVFAVVNKKREEEF